MISEHYLMKTCSDLEQWNGISLMPRWRQQHISTETDASGSKGCGRCWDRKWFQWKWEGMALAWPITTKELLQRIIINYSWEVCLRLQYGEIGGEASRMSVWQHGSNDSNKHRPWWGQNTHAPIMLPIFLQSTAQQFDMQAACTHPKLTNVAADVLSHNLFFRFL